MELLLFADRMPSAPRDKLMFAALTLFCGKGFRETAVLDLVGRAHVSKTTFYQFFRNKEELLLCLFEQLVEEIFAEVKKAVEGEERTAYKAYAGVRRYLEICTRQAAIARLMLISSVGVSTDVEEARRQAHIRFSDLLTRTVGDLLPETVSASETQIVSDAMVGAINEVVIRRVVGGEGEPDIDKLAGMLNRIVVGSYTYLVWQQSADR